MRHLTEFHGYQSNCCWVMAI